jgi:hypothetical protein
MPRSYQAYPQNAVVTHSPATVNGGDPSQAINAASGVFKYPSLLDICSGVTTGTANPFMAGLNTLGDGSNTSGVGGQTGNMLSGLQLFLDTLCGFALGGTSVGEVLEAARQLRAQGGDLHETLESVRRLRDTVGHGTTPQTVLAGVEGVTGLVNSNPLAQSAISTGQAAVGISGNQIIDSINGAQTMADQGNGMLTGLPSSGVSGNGLLNSAGGAINQNTANHAANQSLSTAQSVALKQQNLLVAQDFSSASTVVGDTHWSWDGTDGSPSTNALGCAKVTCDGYQQPLVSSEIPVVAGENIEVSAQVKWSGLTYTGSSPVILAVEKYRLMKDPAGSGQDVYSDVGWSNVYTLPSPAASGDWTGISGTYEVEPNIDQLRFRLEVAENATAGTVKWDDAEFLKLDLISDECVPGVGLTVDDIVTQLYGLDGSGFTHNQSATALANTASALTTVAAEISALQAEGHTGAIAGDDFTFTGEITASPNWGGGYSNVGTFGFGVPPTYYTANNMDAVWQIDIPGLTQTAQFDWEGTDATSTTDYQLIQLVLDSAPQTDIDPTTNLHNKAYCQIYGRVAAGFASYVVAQIDSDGGYSVGYSTGGSVVTMAAGTCAVPGQGAIISLYCGDAPTSSPRHFRFQIGGAIIAEFDEVGTSSPLGSSNRKWGWGGISQGSLPIYQAILPKINQWLALDQ